MNSISIFLKSIVNQKKLVRCMSSSYDDGIDSKRFQKRFKNVENQTENVINKRLFSEEQSIEEKKECILLEIEMMREQGKQVPIEITEENWKFLLSDSERVIENIM